MGGSYQGQPYDDNEPGIQSADALTNLPKTLSHIRVRSIASKENNKPSQ
jgi:hypothetical protein